MLGQLNSKKYSAPSRWQTLAACRNTDPELFVSFKHRDEAAKICNRCVVAQRCLKEPCYAASYQDFSLTGIWGGVWHPSSFPSPQPAYRKLLSRMHLESDNGRWQGNPKTQPALQNISPEEMSRSVRYLLDHQIIQEREPGVWDLQPAGISADNLWVYFCQIADMNGRFVLNTDAAQTASGLNLSQIWRALKILREQKFVFREEQSSYRICLEKAGAR